MSTPTPDAAQPADPNRTMTEVEILQDLFDRSVSAVIKQGCRSMSSGFGQCAYRGAGGAKCAVGHLISDKVYDARYDPDHHNILEGRLVSDPMIRQAVEDSVGYPLPQRAVDMLGMLQVAHDDLGSSDGSDDSTQSRGWLTRFRRAAVNIARVYGLSNLRAAHATDL